MYDYSMNNRHSTHRHHHRKWWLLVVIVLVGSYIGFALSRPLPVLALTTQLPASSTTALTPLSWPAFGESAVGAVGYGVLATNGAQTPLPTASIIKVLTALAVLKQKPIASGEQGPTITLDQTDVNFHDSFVAQDGSVVAVANGEQITEYQMLQALLLPSANNIADSLARWTSGSVDTFIAYANDYAKQLGLQSVVMTDPSGLAVTTFASPTDLVTLGELALGNPVIAEIVGQNTATLPVAGQVYNVNGMLGESGTIGIKTGNNDGDLGAYLFAAKQPVGDSSVTIVGVVMDGPNLSTALRASLPLIQSTAANFSQRTVITEGQHLGYYQVPWQGKVPVVAAKAVKLVGWNAETTVVTVPKQPVRIPTPFDTAVGTATAGFSTGKASAITELELHAPITKPGLLWRLKHAFN